MSYQQAGDFPNRMDWRDPYYSGQGTSFMPAGPTSQDVVKLSDAINRLAEALEGRKPRKAKK